MEKSEFKDKLVSVNRITKVVKGGRRFTFSALVEVGNYAGLIGVGYAKPVPVNPYNLKNPRIDMIKIAAAGPISNFILALLGSLLFVILWKVDMNTDSLKLFFNYFIMINIYLGLFNLIPIHPLDGGQIFGNFISRYNPDIFRQLYQYGPKVLLGIILLAFLRDFQ